MMNLLPIYLLFIYFYIIGGTFKKILGKTHKIKCFLTPPDLPEPLRKKHLKMEGIPRSCWFDD